MNFSELSCLEGLRRIVLLVAKRKGLGGGASWRISFAIAQWEDQIDINNMRSSVFEQIVCQTHPWAPFQL